MAKDDSIKWSRLYVEQELHIGYEISFSPEQSHYLNTVMRKKANDPIRVFNGRDGEWHAEIGSVSKKSVSAVLIQQLRTQDTGKSDVHFVFPPLPKNRMDFMIEKAVELGVSDFHPILTQNTEVRQINRDRTMKQIIEASEQCERLDVPKLHDIQKLSDFPFAEHETVLACLERDKDAPMINKALPQGHVSFIIGPAGGFTQDEIVFLKDRCQAVSLGKNILRCETAGIFALCAINMRG